MDESEGSNSFLSSFFSYIPYVLGILGLIFVVLGLFFSFKKEEDNIIKITDTAVEASSSSKIFIDIEGGVIKPGVYDVSFGGRIQDVLIKAGGLSDDADREWVAKNLNLAAKLVDGTKIYIPKAGEKLGEVQSANLKAQSQAENIININTASLSELDVLSGVGPVTAQKIIDGRPYQKIEELIEKKIINSSVWEKIKEKISVY